MDMKVKKAKKMKFERKYWLEPFFDLITELGPKTENKNHEIFCKSMNIALSGKKHEDVRRKMNR